MTLQFKPLRGRKNSDGSATVIYDFADSGSCLLVEKETAFLPIGKPVANTRYSALFPAGSTFRLAEICENQIILDHARISTDGGKTFSEERPIECIRDNLLSEHYNGECVLRFSFETEDQIPILNLVAEPIPGMNVFVNGKECHCRQNDWRIDRQFHFFCISDMIHKGYNTVDLSFNYRQSEKVYQVLYGGGNEALRNCLSFDTEVEPIYLYGNFRVRSKTGYIDIQPGFLQSMGPFVLCKQAKEIDLSDIVRSGYSFFAGELNVETEINYRFGDPTVVKLCGRFATCCLIINGIELKTELFSDVYDLQPYLKCGKNQLKIKICFSNRNLLGPHHRKEAEPYFVTPKTLSFEKEWRGNCCEEYQNRYSFVQFGCVIKTAEQKIHKKKERT